MQRSRVNTRLREAIERFATHGIQLPPWATWTPAQWRAAGPAAEPVRRCMLGWDITDFGSGDFDRTGLLLFTLRNGLPGGTGALGKPYCEKIMLVREGQVTPMHFHWHKMEDIINRGGGELVVKLFPADPNDEQRLGTGSLEVAVDGIPRDCPAGGTIRLQPGQSITLESYRYHTFWAEGDVTVVGEVSTVNDDTADNNFIDGCGRFAAIEEDEPAVFCLCNEYPES